MPIALDLSLAELNTNHKYRLFFTGFDSSHWLAEIRLARADESIYLIPLLSRPCDVTIINSLGTQTCVASPKSDVHLSLHDSGEINLTSGRRRLNLRPPVAVRSAIGKLFTIVVKSTESLARATVDQINNQPAKKRVVPLGAHWPGDLICISVFRTEIESVWKAPPLGDLAQINVHLPVRGKPVLYHLVVWRHRQFTAPPGEIAILMPNRS